MPAPVKALRAATKTGAPSSVGAVSAIKLACSSVPATFGSGSRTGDAYEAAALFNGVTLPGKAEASALQQRLQTEAQYSPLSPARSIR